MVLFTDFTLSLKKPSNLLGFFDADANTIIKALQSRYGIAGINFFCLLCALHSRGCKKMTPAIRVVSILLFSDYNDGELRFYVFINSA